MIILNEYMQRVAAPLAGEILLIVLGIGLLCFSYFAMTVKPLSSALIVGAGIIAILTVYATLVLPYRSPTVRRVVEVYLTDTTEDQIRRDYDIIDKRGCIYVLMEKETK